MGGDRRRWVVLWGDDLRCFEAFLGDRWVGLGTVCSGVAGWEIPLEQGVASFTGNGLIV